MATLSGAYCWNSPKDEREMRWPWSCRYYDPLTTDAGRVSSFVSKATKSAELVGPQVPPVKYTYVLDGVVSTKEATSSASHGGLFNTETLQAHLVVVHVPLFRRYDGNDATTSFSGTTVFVKDCDLWTTLLDHFEVLPTVLELLHGFEGGTMSFTSYSTSASSSCNDHTATHTDGSPKPVAFHTAYDAGGHLFNQGLIYARCDLVTGHDLVLVLGLDHGRFCSNFDRPSERIEHLLQARPNSRAFEVVAALQKLQAEHLQIDRLECGIWADEMETVTGIGVGTKAWKPDNNVENLAFNKDLYQRAALMRPEIRRSSRTALNCQAYSEHIAQLQALCNECGIFMPMGPVTLQSLLQAAALTLCVLEGQCAGIQTVQARLHAQVDIQRTLMANRDTQINIGIARAAVHDSKLVRGIAFVTMVFLPATFVATFFSMVFFDVDDERSFNLRIDASVWIYPVIAVPLTIITLAVYMFWSSGESRKTVLRLAKARELSGGKEDEGWDPLPTRESMEATEGAYRTIAEDEC